MSKKKNRQSLEQITRLKQLRRMVDDGANEVDSLVKLTKDHARDALKAAILTGKALSEAREILGYGKFSRWIQRECKVVKKTTAYKYLSIYNALGKEFHHGGKLPITNLRKAYITLGIINDPVESDEQRQIIDEPSRPLIESSVPLDVEVISASSKDERLNGVESQIVRPPGVSVEFPRSASIEAINNELVCPKCGHHFSI